MMNSFRAAVRRVPRRAAAHLRAGAHVRVLSSTATAPRPAAVADAAPAHPDPVLGRFTDAFLGELDGASKAASPEESALLLKDLVRAGHLRFTRGRGVRTRRRRSKPVSRVGTCRTTRRNSSSRTAS